MTGYGGFSKMVLGDAQTGHPLDRESQKRGGRI